MSVRSPNVPSPIARQRRPGFDMFRAANPAFVAELQTLRKYRRTELERLAGLTGRDGHTRVRKLLRDRRLHLFYAYDAVRRLDRLREASPQTIAELASRFNAFAPVRDERVVNRLVDKGSGRRRVQDFGPRRRMQQALVADILLHLHPPPRTQTLFNGGMPTALKAVATAFDQGFTHGVEVDFENFYGSVNQEPLAELLRSLPAVVVEHVVWDVAMRDDPSCVTVVSSIADPTPRSLTGLSLGAATSPIVGERIIARVLATAQLPETITYADNLMVLGRSEAEVEARIHRIRESVASLDVGRLGLRVGVSSKYDLTKRFEFVKHEGRLIDRKIVWSPAVSKLLQYQVSAIDRRLGVREIAAAEQRIRQWRRSYTDWPGGDALEAEFLAGLAVRRFYVDRAAPNLSAAIHAVLVAYQAYGGSRAIMAFVPTEGDPSGLMYQRLTREIVQWLLNAEAYAPTVAA